MQALKYVAVVGVLICLAACSNFTGRQELPELPLLPPSAMPNDVQIDQRVTLLFAGDKQTFIAAWVIEQGVFTLVGVTPTGQKLLTLTYNGETFSENYSEMLGENAIPGREVVTHLQLAHWPQATIVAALDNTPWRMTFFDDSRELYLRDKLIMTIYRSGMAAHNKNNNNVNQSPISQNKEAQIEFPKNIKIISHVAAYQLLVDRL